MNNIDERTGKPKIILHLCAGKGSDSQDYADSGYDRRLITQAVDVRLYMPPPYVYGIIANPVCTHLAGSGARWWKEKGTQALLEALEIVSACCRVILISNPKFWLMENPVGRLPKFMGKPAYYYQPYEYGDDYSKKTCLYGVFNMPVKKPVIPTNKDKIWKLPPSENRSELRSVCSPYFAKAFFEANQ